MSQPPKNPLFSREMGLSARFGLYVLASLVIAGVEARYDVLHSVRVGVNGLLGPVRVTLARPWEWLREAGDFFVIHGALQAENRRLRQEREHLLAYQLDRQALQAENRHLRASLELPRPPGVTPIHAEIMQTAPDPFMHRVIINRGSTQGLAAGWPVIDGAGLVGQVTRVFAFTAEVTLLTDKDQGAPVMNMRNGLRLIVSGTGTQNLLEVRFLGMHADIKAGDWLYTSGIDGVYPMGIPVAKVMNTSQAHGAPFIQAQCRPLGGVGRYRQLTVLRPAPASPVEKP